MTAVAVVQTGTANTASVLAALRRLGATPQLVDQAGEVRAADRLVLPGVGAFAAAMQELTARGLVEPLRERLAAGRPTLAICLGLQLLCEGSEESRGVTGLGVLPGTVRRLPDTVTVPQLGWNTIHLSPDAGAGLLQDGYVYYANSYGLTAAPAGWRVAWTEHGVRFVAAAERGPVLACQFHPELSGAFGQALLQRWWDAGATAC